jgi:uncharacterized protein (DUF952 family)
MILHFCPRAAWESAADVYVADSLATAGFIHCSTVDQVAGPANRLARGRTDLVLLEIDETDLPVRWEPGDPPDPSGALFPHVYGPIPAAAVVAVHDYRPGPDGLFAAPVTRRRPAGRVRTRG